MLYSEEGEYLHYILLSNQNQEQLLPSYALRDSTPQTQYNRFSTVESSPLQVQ